MADAVADYGLLKNEKALDVGASSQETIIATAEQEIRVSEDTGSMAFVLMGLTISASTGALSAGVSVGCDTADVSWTSLYTVPTSMIFMGILKVTNVGAVSGTYSVGVTVTEVAGEGAPA